MEIMELICLSLSLTLFLSLSLALIYRPKTLQRILIVCFEKMVSGQSSDSVFIVYCSLLMESSIKGIVHFEINF